MPRLPENPFTLPLVGVSAQPQSENTTGNWRSLKPVIRLEECTGCFICWKYCPEACVDFSGGAPSIEYSHCKGCGICVVECPPKCIEFKSEPEEPCAKS